ncbi:hypothetical protein JCM33374_g1919 [Metschnikowia sp. JCM 33374]|nr:hypothetical protein JCM33374_g1919 [Metschnikowia sp. JCM 33374]
MYPRIRWFSVRTIQGSRKFRVVGTFTQAPLVWNETMDQELHKQEFANAANAPCIYFKGKGNDVLVIALYVDDLIIVGPNQNQTDKVKADLSNRFQMKDPGPVKKFLGINIDHQKDHIALHLTDYIESLLSDYSMSKWQGNRIPISPKVLDEPFSDDANEPCNQSEYRSIVGKVLYAANTVRFDVNYVVSRLSRYLSNAKVMHLKAAKRVLRHLSKTKTFGIVCCTNTHGELTCFSDANFASETDADRPARSKRAYSEGIKNDDYVYMLNVYLGSNKQKSYVLLDTGSSDLWVPTSDYNYKTSSSVRDTGHAFSIEYVDGTTAQGEYYFDKLAFSVFGIADKDQESTQYTDNNLPWALQRAGLTPKASYSLYLGPDHGSGVVIFGGLDTAKYQGSLTKYNIDNSQSSLSLDLSTITAGGQSFSENAPYTMDSGTSLALVSQDMLNFLNNLFNVDSNGLVNCDEQPFKKPSRRTFKVCLNSNLRLYWLG